MEGVCTLIKLLDTSISAAKFFISNKALKALSQGTLINSAEIEPATSSPTKTLMSPTLPINCIASA